MSTLINPADTFVTEMNTWHGRTLGLKTVQALQRNRFDAAFFETREEAAQAVIEKIAKGQEVAFGGSQTARQLNLQQMVSDEGATILDHNAIGLSDEGKMEVMRRQQVCDVFICSSNAISLQGELYNIDGHGNRVAAMAFGPRRVIVIAGVNKLVADEEAAWQRIRTVAAPINFKRLNRPNPCAKHGVCMNCNLPTRGCNIYVATRRKPPMMEFSVFIVNESLGF
ncbi:MAG: lactate utilization protein [Bacteroidota bacterium]